MKKSLKKEILQQQIYFLIFVIIVIGFISMIHQYNSKIETTKHNQKFVLSQIEQELTRLTSNMEKVSDYVSLNYGSNDEFLKNIVNINNNISSILILDKNGIIEDFYTLSISNIFKGFDYSNKGYFKKLENQSSYWSDVFLSTLDDSPTLSYSFKMNEKIGVFMIDMSELSSYILKFKNLDGSHKVRILDSNGIMIINPDSKQMVLERFNASYSEVFTKLISSNNPYSPSIFKDKNGKQDQFGSYIKSYKTRWYVVVRESHNYILKSLTSMIYLFLLAISIFIILSIMFSLKISRNIFKSFDDMQETTSKIASGDYDIKLYDSHYDEFDKMLNSFNKMQIEIDKREENLENSLNSFKSLFNSTMESVILHKHGVCIDVNDVTLELFRAKSKDQLVGKNIFDFISEEYKELTKINMTKNSTPYELELIRVDGTKMQALVQGKFLELYDKVVRVTAIIDITELKNKDQLLFQQSKMASMGEMIGNIAHQWRQPLSIISTCASGVKFEKEFGLLSDDRLNESMDVIVENTQYLSRTIDDFRNFFKSEKQIEKFEVNTIIDKALHLLDSTLKNNNITVSKKFNNKNFLLEGYPNEFIQVLINIINNSRDAFVSNAIENRYVEIEEINGKNIYKLLIKDNAGGISPSIIDKIFDPYFTTKHKSQGTGIGLYMSHQIIVDHMKGNIFVENVNINFNNRISKGCMFCIEFNKNIEHQYTYNI